MPMCENQANLIYYTLQSCMLTENHKTQMLAFR